MVKKSKKEEASDFKNILAGLFILIALYTYFIAPVTATTILQQNYYSAKGVFWLAAAILVKVW